MIIERALGKENIDEIIHLSQNYKNYGERLNISSSIPQDREFDMPRSYRGSYYDSSDDDYPPGITVINTPRSRQGPASRRRQDDRIYIAGDLLSAPSEAGRLYPSSSTGGRPQPQLINVVVQPLRPERNHSRDRRRERRSSSAKQQEADREYERKLKKEIEIQKAKELYEAEQKAKKDKELQKEYVERWKREEAEKREKEKREKEKREKEKREKEKREKEEEDAKFEKRFKIQFMQAGYTEEQVEAILKKKKNENEKKQQNTQAIDLNRPTCAAARTDIRASQGFFNFTFIFNSTATSPNHH
jgi:hypothetical protein